MAENISIHKRKEESGVCYSIYLEVEEIENGWLVTKRVSKYTKGDYDEPMEPGKETVTKKYYKANPLAAQQAVWEKF